MPWDGGWVELYTFVNDPHYTQYILCTVVTPECDISTSAQVGGSWVGLV